MVSVIIPVYKVEKYLRQCVDSVLNQTYTDLEIILVDDGSPDRCGEICDAYAKKDTRVIVIHKENGGLSDARNAGMNIAQGEYIYFLDSDDYIKPDAIECLVNIADKEHADIVFFSMESFSEDEALPAWNIKIKRHYETLRGAETLKQRIKNKEWLPGAPLHFYKAEFLRSEHILFKKGIIYEDVPFSGIAYVRAQRVSMYDNPLYCYRIRKESTTTVQLSTRNLECYCICIEELSQEKKRYNRNSLETEAVDLLIKHTAEEYVRVFSRLKRQEREKSTDTRLKVLEVLSQVHSVNCEKVRLKLSHPRIWCLCFKVGKGVQNLIN